MIYDTSIFLNEFELLKIRLEELWDKVDSFVVAEANLTFSGESKPFWLNERLHEFSQWRSKLHVVRVMDMPTGVDPWEREIRQRQGVMEFLGRVQKQDVVIHGDADEIPSVKGISHFKFSMGMAELGMRSYLKTFNNRFPNTPKSRIMSGDYLLRTFTIPFQAKRLQKVKTIIPNGGWEFVYCAPAKDVVQKMKWFSHHSEERMEPIRQEIDNDFNAFASRYTLKTAKINSSFPRRIVRLKKYYEKQGLIS